jgi:phospholipid-binding lipoprotein MlaA
MTWRPKSAARSIALATALLAAVGAVPMLSAPAWCQTAAKAPSAPPGEPPPPPGEENMAVYSDPLEPFNSAMFTFNLKLDDWVLHPVASGYSYVAPQPVRESVGRFFDNVGVIPRFANNVFQLRFAQAGGEVARFGINTTVGLLGFFDPAKNWFGIRESDDDFGLTLRYYKVPTGPYLMLPFFGPSTIGDTVGRVADGAMNPLSYLVPWYVTLAATGGQDALVAVNYRSLHLNQFEEADRYAVDLYGAVQDAYLETRQHDTDELKK